MKVYIAGSITAELDDPYAVRSKFRLACEAVNREHGCETFNPVSIPEEYGWDKPWSFYMKKCIAALIECDGIFVMDGSSGSRGVCLESIVAEMLGLEMVRLEDSAVDGDVFVNDIMKVIDGYCEGEDQQKIAKVFARQGAKCLAKNKDYGGAAWRRPLLLPSLDPGGAIMVRMSDKVERLASLLKSGSSPRVDESIEDTMADFGSYAFLWLARPES